MKTINITPFLLALSLLVSCSSDGDDGPEVVVPQDATLTMAIAPGSVLTKAKAGEPQEGEAKINNMYAALFKADQTLLTSAYVDFNGQTGETPDTIRISAKSDTPYKYIILVNVGNINCSSIGDLMKKTYNLKDIRVSNQPMGSKFLEIESLKPGTNYYGKEEIFKNKPAEYSFYSTSNIEVYRTASRIDFEKISLKWSEADAGDLLKEGARFRLKQVYVVDAKSTTYLADRKYGGNNYSVETSGSAYWHGKPGEDYLESLDLFPREGNNTSATIPSDGEWNITENPLRCYITENTDKTKPTMLVLKGDILHKDTDAPILSDRYYFVKLLNLIDSDNKETIYPGVIRNKVIRISATITGKGSGDEEYKENAYVKVTVTPENWSVETQHEDVN
ncbi:fimbrial protein [uncultured Parabacteroides sp.]|uniref:fimbrial protein n=1 Tax=Parabacteroides goldsteinii TaxID=328812 RepID=UPI002591F2EB|nr:fimbrial protein [uncultured Parabacteroides sp.]